ncbi:hypothetical protein MCOR07_005851 [Pyricularia oryzae]|uniref:Uncharacterized protein n=3 Tax=Pyricularia oryzae TaxID=318829 RepID=A0A4P7NHU0_PYROR|nr:hypothetical protein OOU_Y34scaffold00095g43 [Pyricularia oryzae Y34]KAH8843331.1 hypothetical protein MCOR01_004148 [Pyricularia oryzae]KAI6332481.1 hypothetical protein MCOR28_010848 [Pyricularia oryzae]KAI6339416.1 hypothetical protein MCOR30_002806 [Pyricularia oryzae]KAI6392018.1 hypothetical protein MCOR23_008670 [Pyricularia oryzae]
MQGQVRSGQPAGKQCKDCTEPPFVAPLQAFGGGAAEASQNRNLCAKVVFSNGLGFGADKDIRPLHKLLQQQSTMKQLPRDGQRTTELCPYLQPAVLDSRPTYRAHATKNETKASQDQVHE